jgi:hypothetical protein
LPSPAFALAFAFASRYPKASALGLSHLQSKEGLQPLGYAFFTEPSPQNPYKQLMLTRPALLLRIEEAALLTLTLYAYHHLHGNWILFAILFLTPDLFMIGYLITPHIGSATYNLAHTLTLPFALLLAGYIQHHPLAIQLALIWTAHIALDRLLGFGLKYPTLFKDTHLQHIA